ncbi:imidazoleglycerol-phosphate dehydratase HisB [Candidatus Woesearchaeota archaeon]|nr:imidazoleglycerol-phosphate dehydratase HisB [Candidatus Woesearchaeota archaeon]
MRIAEVDRKTKETQITIRINIDGEGDYSVSTQIGFLDHMLESFSKHGLFDLKIEAEGDLKVDQHHTIEDTGLVLGQAFKEALGKKKGINRTGYFAFPMDDSLSIISVDIGGRPYLQFNAKFRRRFCGELDTDMIEQFFAGFAIGLGCNITINAKGKDDHHKIESIFKAFGKAMRMACTLDSRAAGKMPSTKGMI